MSVFHTNGHNKTFIILLLLKIVYISSQIGESTESINETIDKLIKLTDVQSINDGKKSINVVKGSGNDSDILYFKNPTESKNDHESINDTEHATKINPKNGTQPNNRRKMEPQLEVPTQISSETTVNEFEVNLANTADTSAELQSMIDKYISKTAPPGERAIDIEITPVQDDPYPFTVVNEPVDNFANQFPGVVAQITQEIKSPTNAVTQNSQLDSYISKDGTNNEHVMYELKRLYAEVQLMKAFQAANAKQADIIMDSATKNEVNENLQQNANFNEQSKYNQQSQKKYDVVPQPTVYFPNPYPIMQTVINRPSIPLHLQPNARRMAYGFRNNFSLPRARLLKRMNYLNGLANRMLVRY